MIKKLSVVCCLLAFVSCAKKSAPGVQPAPANSQAQETVGGSGPATENPASHTPFVIPPSAKKQAKYYPEGSPVRAIQDLDDMLDSYVTDPQTPEQKQYNADLKRAILHGTFDIRELCSLALGKHSAERTPQEQDYFVNLMIRLLEKKAIFSKEQGLKKKKLKSLYQITYSGQKFLNPEQTNAMAMSKVHVPSESLTVDLNYKLKKENGQWKIYDVIVDEASLLDNYKYQFDKIIEKEGYPSLVHRMESKLQELEQGNK